MSIKKLIKQPSILAEVITTASELDNIHTSKELQQDIARRLEASGTLVSKSRADFILNQQANNFNKNRKSWGIPDFSEDLVTIDDFENGFLWRFRAHTTSWSHNQHADKWFYTSLEARSVTRYEFWDCDEGPETTTFVLTGDYKSILQQLLAEHIHEVLISPAFSKEELTKYIDNFSEKEEDYLLDELIKDYISQNPNFSTE
jgi:hypothetical protein